MIVTVLLAAGLWSVAGTGLALQVEAGRDGSSREDIQAQTQRSTTTPTSPQGASTARNQGAAGSAAKGIPSPPRPVAEENAAGQGAGTPHSDAVNQGSGVESTSTPPPTPASAPETDTRPTTDRTNQSPAPAASPQPTRQDSPASPTDTGWPTFLLVLAGLFGVTLGMLLARFFGAPWTRDDPQPAPIPQPSGILADEAQHSLDRRLMNLEYMLGNLPNMYSVATSTEDAVNRLAQQLRKQQPAPAPRDNDHILAEMRDRLRDLERSVDSLGRLIRSQPREPAPQPPAPVALITPPEPPPRTPAATPVPAAPSAEERAYVDRIVRSANQMLARQLSTAEFQRHFSAMWVTRADGSLVVGNQEPGPHLADGFLLVRPSSYAALSSGGELLVPGMNFFERRAALNDLRSVQSVFDGLFDVQTADGDRLIAPAVVSTNGQTVTVMRRGQLQFAL